MFCFRLGVVLAIALTSLLIPRPALALNPDDLIRGLMGIAGQEMTRQRREPIRVETGEQRLSQAQRQQLQEALNARGFNVGKPDGSFGGNTRRGIARYQSSRGQQASGFLTNEQIADLLSSPRPPSQSAASRSVQGTESGFTVLSGVDYPGNDLREARNTDLHACQSLCASESLCRAFTHNTARNVCFLKSGFGRSVAFAGAVSGHKTATAAPVAGGDRFDVFRDSDIPHGDYRSGLTEAGLRDIPASTCQAACAADGRCAAFTYNEAKAVCFLKDAAGGRQSFAGAISGIRRAGTARGDDDVAWKEGESEAEFIARIRAAAKPFGGSCEAEEAAFRQLAATMRVEHDGPASVQAGSPIAFRWTHGGRRDHPPAYLVITAEKPVRFSGEGFYALLPGSRAPFGIEARRERTRAIVPLSGDGAPASGEVRLHPVLAGNARIDWFLAGYLRQCGKEIAGAGGGFEVAVTPGLPEIAVDDPFALSAPKRAIASPDGTRLIREYENHFQLLETGRMSVLGDYTGTSPRFSVTGRFVTFQQADWNEDDTGSASSNILDAIDGRPTGSAVNVPAAWAHDDSFVIGDGLAYGIVDVVNPLRANGDLSGDNRISCFACSAWDGTRFRLDLENNVAVFATEVGREPYLHIKSLTSETVVARDMWNEDLSSAGEALRLFRQRHQIAGFRQPAVWELEGGLRLSMPQIDPHLRDHPSAKDHDRFAIEPILLSGGAARVEALNGEASLSRSVEWRGATSLVPSRPAQTDYREKLEGFGFRFASRVTPDVLHDSAKPIWSEDGVRDRLREELWQRDERLRETIRTTTFTSSGQTFTNNCASPFTRDSETEERLTFDAPDIEAHGMWSAGPKEFSFLQIACSDGARAGASWTEFFVLDRNHPKGIRAADFAGSYFHLYGDMLVGWSEGGAQVADISDFGGVRRVEFRSRSSLTVDVRLTEDRNHIVQINSDGSFFVHALDSAAQILEGRYLDDEIVVWMPDLRFDATAEGAHYISARFPGNLGQYTFQQLAARLQVDGLVDRLLSGGETFETPQIGVPPRLSAEVEMFDSARVAGSVAIEAFAAVREVRVFQDGVLTDTIAVGSQARASFDVPRLAGARWISFVAVDELGMLSLPVGRDLGPAGPEALPVVRSLSVGVDRYDDGRLANLSFAVADTQTLAKGLAASDGTSIALAASTTLPNEEASPEAVLSAVERMVAEAGPGETLTFFFAGHGITGNDGRYYLATTTTDAGRIAETALPWDAVSAILARSAARVLVFLDACHSGVAGTGMAATNDDAAADMLAAIPSGLVILSASKGRQFSEENRAAGGGVFTNAVADVIARQRPAHDANGNGAIEVSELYAGVKRLVMERTDGRQTPWLVRNQMVGDFALF